MPLFRIPTQEILWGPAPIDWCEPNHPEINPWGVQEFHNTWSNVAYIVVGIVCACSLTFGQSSSRKDPLLYCFCVSVIMTGITSAWFHATLLCVGQKSDEFFENAMILGLLYSHLFPLEEDEHKRYIYFGIHVVFLGVGVFCIPEAFCEIHLVCAILATVYISRQRCDTIKNAEARQQAIDTNHRVVLWGAGGFAFWIVDQVACYSHPIVPQLHLHAFAWHWFTAVGLYTACSGSIVANRVLEHELKSKQS